MISKCKTLLEANVSETDSKSLLESFELLNEKSKILKELDSEIDPLINEKGEHEKEVKSVEHYDDKILRAIFKIKIRLNKCKNNATSNGSRDIDRKNSSNCCKPVLTVKLPKLSIEKFHGDPSTFLEFFNYFKNAIDKNDSLSKIEKFSCMKSLLAGIGFRIN